MSNFQVDTTRRVIGLEEDYPDFSQDCRKDLREGGPDLLQDKAKILKLRLEKLEQQLKSETAQAKKSLLSLLRGYHPDADEPALNRTAERIVKGAPLSVSGARWKGSQNDRPFFEEALSAKKEQSSNPEQVEWYYKSVIGNVLSKRRQVVKTKDHIRIARYLLDDWAQGRSKKGNPFEGTTKAFDYCTRVIDAYYEALDNQRPMKEMKHLWMKLGGGNDAARIERAVRDVLKRAGIRAGDGYEGGNPSSFVMAVEEVVKRYNESI
jgi:hypothetical protein